MNFICKWFVCNIERLPLDYFIYPITNNGRVITPTIIYNIPEINV